MHYMVFRNICHHSWEIWPVITVCNSTITNSMSWNCSNKISTNSLERFQSNAVIFFLHFSYYFWGKWAPWFQYSSKPFYAFYMIQIYSIFGETRLEILRWCLDSSFFQRLLVQMQPRVNTKRFWLSNITKKRKIK